MKKIFMVVCLLSILMCGCSGERNQQQETTAFTLSSKEQDSYKQIINDVLNSFYWRYDENSRAFFEEKLPDKDSGEDIYKASELSGYKLNSKSGDNVIVATVDLMHFNGQKAGLGYFYFDKHKLIGLCYAAKDTNKIYSLNNRNVFKRSVDFKTFESEENDKGTFKERRIGFTESGFTSIATTDDGGTKLICLEENNISIYKYKNNMSLMKQIYFSNGLVPISATFFDGENIAVLLGENIYSQNEDGYELSGTISDKVQFYDKNYNLIGELPLESSNYSCVANIENQITLFRDNAVEFYSKSEDGFVIDDQVFINHRVTAIKYDDLDGNGVEEYIMTDGMDLYLYHKTPVAFICLWQTNIGVESLLGNIYTGDLNSDGVKEIYICDNTGTVIRYILTENGLVSSNDDISYGEKIFAADFNSDGKDDYINYTMGPNSNIVRLFMGD